MHHPSRNTVVAKSTIISGWLKHVETSKSGMFTTYQLQDFATIHLFPLSSRAWHPPQIRRPRTAPSTGEPQLPAAVRQGPVKKCPTTKKRGKTSENSKKHGDIHGYPQNRCNNWCSTCLKPVLMILGTEQILIIP